MKRRLRHLCIALFCLATTACGGGLDTLRPGESGIDNVRALLGEPAMRWQESDGRSRLAYPRGPMGLTTLMADFAADGRLEHIENVLDEAHFAAITPDMPRTDVLRHLGPPDPGATIHFPARNELALDWRYCDAWFAIARFIVLIDTGSDTVRERFSLRENCLYGDCRCSGL